MTKKSKFILYYLIITASDAYTDMSFYSIVDMRMGRIFFGFAITSSLFILYLEPSWFHETIGHITPIPKNSVLLYN